MERLIPGWGPSPWGSGNGAESIFSVTVGLAIRRLRLLGWSGAGSWQTLKKTMRTLPCNHLAALDWDAIQAHHPRAALYWGATIPQTSRAHVLLDSFAYHPTLGFSSSHVLTAVFGVEQRDMLGHGTNISAALPRYQEAAPETGLPNSRAARTPDVDPAADADAGDGDGDLVANLEIPA
eukprot:TRINITY_DN62747_c0_g1_i1.p4 TRINITY_DN62747_c0_g1~~TRINITY_DN62747_c0_g1_i1.p4  ORF type:complete len:179 (+),score=36.83 TRINITY_DN62747_c0_g1_i1:149-685(+)